MKALLQDALLAFAIGLCLALCLVDWSVQDEGPSELWSE